MCVAAGTLEGYLIVWQPAMAVPAAVRRDEDVLLDPACEVAPVYGWDHLLHAVHRDAAPILSGPPIRHVERAEQSLLLMLLFLWWLC